MNNIKKMLMDFMLVKSRKEKNKLNFYLNDNNLYVQNSIKMRKKHVSYFNNKIKIRNDLKKKYPVPKIIYSTSDLNFHKRQNRIIESFSPKNAVKDLMDVVNNFTENLNFDDEEDEENKSDNISYKDKINDEEKKNDKDNKEDNKIKTIKNNTNNDDYLETKENNEIKYNEFFLTNKYMFNKKKIKKNPKIELLNDLEFAKSKSTKEAITSQNIMKKINNNKRMFKTNLYFEDYGKYKFTKNGLLYPKKLGKYELPNYTGNNEEEKKYFNYRKKIFKPQLTYNKINNFSEKLNRDLGKYSNNYGNIMGRTRFIENPLMKKYMNAIPFYEIYKDLKQIENRYIGSKYKFKLLPLYNKKLSSLDKVADRFYRTQTMKDGLNGLLNIQSASYDNKNK